jgi:RNA polymerase sigma-70 factor (ECF subfamily)
LSNPTRTIDEASAAFRAAGVRAEELPTARELFELVHRQMRGFVGPRPDLDDLVQTAFWELREALERFQGRASVATYSHAVCYRVWLKHLRWTSRWLRRFAFTLQGELPETSHDSPGPLELMQQRERYQRLYRALETITPKRRAVVVMHDLGGLSIEEIAEVVSAKPATVRSRLRDGRKLLGVALRADPYFGDEACSKEENP